MTMLFKDVYDQEALEKDLMANCGRPYQQCALSVMDTIADPNITFDEKGICNYYYEYLAAEKKHLLKGEEGKSRLENEFKKIKKAGKFAKYDCILGLSGGVDSTYLCLLAAEHGLNPLVVHFDNGWNSELAQHNIENTVKICGFDLYTYVVEWREFKEMQLAYLRASVVDIEVLTDHAFMSVLYEQARKWKIKYVLAGMNIVTEQVLPRYWIYNKADAVNIRDIVNTHGSVKIKNIKTYPFLNYFTKKYCDEVLNMSIVTPLNWIDYNYDTVKKEIIEKLNWRDYGGKHYESVWTRFYQGFILPKKFHIDKRKAHLSNLIFSGQMTKDKAQEKLLGAIINPELGQSDFEFVLKKMSLTQKEFDDLLKQPRKEHLVYKSQKGFWESYPLLKFFRPVFNVFQG